MFKGVTLPQEIITDILSRLPVKSLCRLKCVSPSWNSFISDNRFARTHLNRTKAQNPKYLDQKIIITTTDQSRHQKKLIFSDNLYSVDFSDGNPTATKLDIPMVEQHAVDNRVKVWSTCDGLFLVSRLDNFRIVPRNDSDSIFFLLNPSTRECKKLPTLPFAINPVKGAFLSFNGVGYDSSTDDYKVLIVYGCGDDWTYESYCDSYVSIVAVYSLNTNAWRRIQDFPYMLVSTSGGVFFNGGLHCLCWSRTGPTGTFVIVAFDWSDEIFKEVPLPALFHGRKIPNISLAVLGGCLCLVDGGGCLRSRLVEVWMMEEYGVGESWTKFSIDMCGLPGLYSVEVLCSLAIDEFLVKTEGNRLIELREEKLVVYNPKRETQRDMVVHGLPTNFKFWGAFVESLVSPNHVGRR